MDEEVNLSEDEKRSESIINKIGTKTFIIVITILLTGWILWNTFTPLKFDPPPFFALNLIMSVSALYTLPVIILKDKAAEKKINAKFNRINAKLDKEE